MLFVRYSQAAASAKDMVILLDVSGSMKDSKLQIGKEIIRKIIQVADVESMIRHQKKIDRLKDNSSQQDLRTIPCN